MADPFIAEIRIVPFTFAPFGWAYCDGQTLPIAQNTALFSLLGTMYGGDGRTTFALPNLGGRAPMHPGSGPGLTPRAVGETGGTETVQLTVSQMPAHSHFVKSTEGQATATNPASNLPAGAPDDTYQNLGSKSLVAMDGQAIAPNGSGQPHSNLQPYLSLNFVIALQGIFPPRN